MIGLGWLLPKPNTLKVEAWNVPLLKLSRNMIERECSRILTRIEPLRKRFPDVVVSCGTDDIRIACEGREVRVPLPDGALEWSLDDLSNKILLQALMNLTNYEPSLGG